MIYFDGRGRWTLTLYSRNDRRGVNSFTVNTIGPLDTITCWFVLQPTTVAAGRRSKQHCAIWSFRIGRGVVVGG